MIAMCEACGEFRRSGDIPECCPLYTSCMGTGEGKPEEQEIIIQLPGQVEMEGL